MKTFLEKLWVRVLGPLSLLLVVGGFAAMILIFIVVTWPMAATVVIALSILLSGIGYAIHLGEKYEKRNDA
jgi:hypothetical protein